MDPRTRRILITGATGFIGSRLALHGHSQGLRITAVGPVRNETERQNARELEAAGMAVVDATLDDLDRIRSSLVSQDVVVHLAAAQHETHLTEVDFHAVNVEGTRRLVQLAREAGVHRFVFGSTIGVYGDTGTNECSELDPVAPTNPYTRSKLAAERAALEAAGHFDVVIARISETYGPGDLRLLKLFRSIEAGLYRTLGDGQNIHQPIYIDDLCRALLELACTSTCGGETFIVAGTERLTTDSMVAAIGQAVGRPAYPTHLPAWPFRVAAVLGEAILQPLGIQPPLHRRRLDFFLRSFQFSTDKAERLTGWRSAIPFEEGAARTADAYRRRGLLKTEPLDAVSLAKPSNPLTHPRPTPHAGHPDPLLVSLFATGFGLALLALWRLQHQLGPLVEGLFTKEGPFEFLTFVLELVAAIWCASAVLRFSRFHAGVGPLARWLYAALGVLLFVVAMEEINWGQTLIGFKTPEAWAAINYQHETSIHNLVDKDVLTHTWKAISALFGLSVVILAGIRWRAPASLLGTIAPHAALVPLALCITYAGLRQHPEMVELLMSVFFAFYTYRVWSISKRVTADRNTPANSTEHSGKISAAWIVKVVVAVTLLALLLSRVDWSDGARIASRASLPLLFGALIAMSLTLVVSAWKWQWALRLHEIRHNYPFLLRTLSIGFFFNHFLPTAVGGDAYRVLQTLPRDGFRSRALSAIVIERLVGLSVLMVLGGVAALRLVETRGVMQEYLYAAAAVVALIAIAILAIKTDWVHRSTQRWHSVPAVKAIRHNLALLSAHPHEWMGLILGSFAFQLISIGIIFVLFSAFAMNVTPAQCAVIAAMVGLASTLPISINGLGVMEGAFVATAVALRIDFEHALLVAFARRMLAVLIAVPCGALWLAQGRKQLSPNAGPLELSRYFSAWKRAGMRGLLDELQPVAQSTDAFLPMNDSEPDVPLTASGPDHAFSHAALLDYTHDAIVIWEMQGRGILYWNRAAEGLYGYPRSEALGKVTHSLLRTEVTGGVVALESTLARYGIWLGELRHVTRDGRKVAVEGRLSLMSQQNGKWLVLEVNRDITDRKAAESARRRIEAQLAELRGMIDSRD